MGRGGETTYATNLVRKNSARDFAKTLSDAEKLLKLWKMRSRSEEESRAKTVEDIIEARANALKTLTYKPEAQRKIMLAAREAGEIIEELEGKDPLSKKEKALLERAKRVDNDARELFILCHRGFVDHLVTKHTNRFDSESPETAREILKQACDIGLHRTIDRYDFSEPSNPLTYATRVMLDEIKREAEAGRLIRLKSKANTLGDKIERAAKEMESEGREADIEIIAKRVGEKPERVAEILPHARRRTVRLDAPISTSDDEQTSLANVIPDAETSIEEIALYEDTRERVLSAINSLNPFEKTVIEVAYGLGENGGAEQKDLFDGVYRDKKGQGYSSRMSIIEERKKRGENIIKMNQKELTEKFKADEFVFEPGNPEAHALALAGKGKVVLPGETLSRYITKETGVPPTSGTIQDALRKALRSLSESKQLKGLEPEYRGDNVLENSEKARAWARKELLQKGVISTKDFEKLQETRKASGAKSNLRLLAEKHGLVDKDQGRKIK
jgi:DNA-directed RNA polymerase specialized sigma subunit